MKYTMKLHFGGSVVAEDIEADREPRIGDGVTLPGRPMVIYEVYRVLQAVGEDNRQRTVAYVIERMP